MEYRFINIHEHLIVEKPFPSVFNTAEYKQDLEKDSIYHDHFWRQASHFAGILHNVCVPLKSRSIWLRSMNLSKLLLVIDSTDTATPLSASGRLLNNAFYSIFLVLLYTRYRRFTHIHARAHTHTNTQGMET